jgi:SAM-dependent methyltransferase
MKISGDLIVINLSEDKWILYNVRRKSSVAVSSTGIASVTLIASGRKPVETGIEIWDSEFWSHIEGLLEDPSCIRRKLEDCNGRILSVEDFTSLLLKKGILVNNFEDYSSYFAPKKSILDFEHQGSLHQQLGQQLLLKKTNPKEWWLKQKFTDGYAGLKENLYKYVQAPWIEEFFRKNTESSSVICDIGCGNGFWAGAMNINGAKIIGLDPNDEYISLCRKRNIPDSTFKTVKIASYPSFSELPGESVDIVFMSDALLFYFIAPEPNPDYTLKLLMTEIRRILKKNGRFVSMEPHCIFFQNAWLGTPQLPFTIITEYNNRTLSIVPRLSRMINSITEHGFLLSAMHEPGPSENLKDHNPRAYYFAKEFPVWQIFDFVKAEK